MKRANRAGTPSLPTGTLTFLMTDVVGSTRLWEESPEEMSEALARHDSIIAETVERHRGALTAQGEGDSVLAAFPIAGDGVGCALEIDRALLAESWPPEAVIRVRMALHTGEAELRAGTYYGTALNRCARLRSIAHGGQILLSRATHDLVRDSLSEGAGVIHLGRHRLKDLSRPEDVYQLIHSDLPGDFPPLQSLGAFPNNLPVQLTSFVGRERDLSEVEKLLEVSRLVTVTGAGGFGKTRLGLQAAGDVLDRYPDGAWFVELATLTDPALVPATVASALGVREESRPPGGSAGSDDALAALVDHLGPRQLLLVLDNCEHLAQACAELAGSVLASCPQVDLLATSREPLRVSGERVWPLAPMEVPDPDHIPALDDFALYDSVRLFLERALLANPHFRLTDENSRDTARICRRLEGMPLAIELAAARLNFLTPRQIAGRLEDHFDLLSGDPRADPRHRTLDAAVDWSHKLLEEREKITFRRLAVFAGGFTLDAAEAVVAGDGMEPSAVLDLLSDLVTKSLVVPEERGDENRYSMHEAIRQYAGKRLADSGELPSLRHRHLEWFLEFAELAGPRILGPEQLLWLDRLDAEGDNLRAALGWGLGEGDVEKALRLTVALRLFWGMRGSLAEGRTWLGEAIAVSETTPSELRARALSGAGLIARYQGDYPAARALLEQALEAARECDKLSDVAAILSNLGYVARYQGDYARARTLFEEALGVARSIEEELAAAIALSNLALIEIGVGEYDEARRLLAESLALTRKLQDRWSMGFCLFGYGMLALSLGETAEARSHLEEALRIGRELGDRRAQVATLSNLSEVARLEGDAAGARRWAEEALEIAGELGDLRASAFATAGLARAALQESQPEGAALIAEALILANALGERPLQAELIVKAAAAASAGEVWDTAARLGGAAEALYEKMGAQMPPVIRAPHESNLAEARRALGDDAFGAAWGEGVNLTPDGLVAEVSRIWHQTKQH